MQLAAFLCYNVQVLVFFLSDFGKELSFEKCKADSCGLHYFMLVGIPFYHTPSPNNPIFISGIFTISPFYKSIYFLAYWNELS